MFIVALTERLNDAHAGGPRRLDLQLPPLRVCLRLASGLCTFAENLAQTAGDSMERRQESGSIRRRREFPGTIAGETESNISPWAV